MYLLCSSAPSSPFLVTFFSENAAHLLKDFQKEKKIIFIFNFFEDTLFLFEKALNVLGGILSSYSKQGPGKLGKYIWFGK
jgi:hypothetical protein